uniref:Ig-like domain-containing protein n=1 Tax=Anas zonorhyncha TaxID=75864 RepID=A0A8B9UBR0_9AVES
MAGGLGPRLLALALALGPAGVWAQWRLVESGGGVQAPGNTVHLSCRGSGFTFSSFAIRWYRQAPDGCLEGVSYISSRSGSTKQYGAAVHGRAAASRNNSQAKSSLSLQHLHVGDSGRYFCAVRTGTGNTAGL